MNGLLPREHGAYAQLGFPLLTGLVYAGGHPGGFAFAVAAVALFLAHEPLSILVGHRGVRLRDALVGPSRRRLWFLAGLTAAALTAAVLLAPWEAWQGALIPALPGLLLIPLFLSGRVKTLAGELTAALAFSGCLIPIALSGPVGWPGALVAAAVWYGATFPAILSVHAVKALHKGRPRGPWVWAWTVISAVLVVVVAMIVAWTLAPPALRALAVLPSSLAVMAVALLRPHPRHLKRIGWTVVLGNLATLALLLAL